MRKIFIILIVIFVSISYLFSIEIVAPQGPPTVPLIKMTKENPEFKLKLYTDVTSQVIPEFIKSNNKIFVMPSNIAAKLYNKTNDVRIISIISSGLLYLLSSNDLQSIKELKNKKIYIPAPGSSPDIIANKIFNYYNINPDIEYSSSFQIAKLIISKRIKYCVLPEPLATKVQIKNKDIKRLVNFKKQWSKITKQDIMPQVVLVTKKNFILKNEGKINKLINEYKKSVQWVNKNPKKAAAISHKKLKIGKKIIIKSIPKMNLISINGIDAYNYLEVYFNELKKFNKKIIGGKIPDEKIIYK